MANNKPVAKFSAGLVSAALWENEINVSGTAKTVLKASVSRRYKDGNEWKTSNSFSRNEIPLAIYCLQKAFERMVSDNKEESAPEDDALE